MGSIFEKASSAELRALCQAVSLSAALDVDLPFSKIVEYAEDDISQATRRLVDLYNESIGVHESLDSPDQVITSLAAIDQRISLVETYPSCLLKNIQNSPKISTIEYIDKVGQYLGPCRSKETNDNTYTLRRVVITAAIHGELGFRLPNEFPTVQSIDKFISLLQGTEITIHKWYTCNPDCKIEFRESRALSREGHFPFEVTPPELSKPCPDCTCRRSFPPFKQCLFTRGPSYSWRKDGTGIFQLCDYKIKLNDPRLRTGVRFQENEGPWKSYLRWKNNRIGSYQTRMSSQNGDFD
ncbi:uncharacterized protein FMAN_14220 [Fusarium mangiferae]|uniref:Uncharacterized protein n=1 Tax=Fusarium mangiferae TaxID=192010 RepID=A0A1L7ULK8_FUSMA|nr:uncharacterized protein FMAN_14220 [Fusarium mangiferae]CVL08116.1 uncharacterized protein FMAN_14220 [Fusarium mangiferae]